MQVQAQVQVFFYLACESAHPRSTDLGSLVNEKLEVKYMGGDTNQEKAETQGPFHRASEERSQDYAGELYFWL